MPKYDVGEIITAFSEAVNKLDNLRTKYNDLEKENARLRAALKDARRDALEEAASLVDDVHQWDGRDEYCESCKGGAVYPDARDVAAIIRALGEKE
jgi:hypothetical protein